MPWAKVSLGPVQCGFELLWLAEFLHLPAAVDQWVQHPSPTPGTPCSNPFWPRECRQCSFPSAKYHLRRYQQWQAEGVWKVSLSLGDAVPPMPSPAEVSCQAKAAWSVCPVWAWCMLNVCSTGVHHSLCWDSHPSHWHFVSLSVLQSNGMPLVSWALPLRQQASRNSVT